MGLIADENRRKKLKIPKKRILRKGKRQISVIAVL